VAAGIMFIRGVLSCLKYLEVVPWSEDEEEKMKSLFTRYTFDKKKTEDVLGRLYPGEERELKSLVKGLLSNNSVYEKELTALKKEDLYQIYLSCSSSKMGTSKQPFIERISLRVDNKWLFEILGEQQMAEEFVNIWEEHEALLKMHKIVSPMVNYEVSRISASMFIALGKGMLLLPSESRCGVFQSCKSFGESMGHALLMLPMKHQHMFFMEWFESYSKHGADCPNLISEFQIWWRWSFFSGSKSSHTVELEAPET
ncbi:hypothetical protein MKX03_002742, partial [Papaver bracteatum]